MAGTDSTQTLIASGPAIILVEPQLGQNIGTAARAMANFGLSDLRLVAPRDGWPDEAARKAASGADWVIDGAQIFATAEDATADLGRVYATTARPRDMKKTVSGPQEAVEDLKTRVVSGERTGVLFGRERWGLTNDEVSLADAILTYPVNPAFASLNIAQAVLIFGYEWFSQTGPDSGFSRQNRQVAPEPMADKANLFRLFEHLENELDAGGFLHPPARRPTMINALRNLLHRAQLSDHDVRTLRGVIVALTGHRYDRKPKEGAGEEADSTQVEE